MTVNLLRPLLLTTLLAAPGIGQGTAAWDAATGLLPSETVPEWSHDPTPTGVGGCTPGSAALGAGVLTVDTSLCREQRHTYGLLAGTVVLPPGPGTYGVEGELRIVSTLALDPDCGAAQLAVVAPPACPWILHIDEGEVFLEGQGPGTMRTASVAVDTTSHARTYRLEVDRTTLIATAFVDGQAVITAPFAVSGGCLLPGANFGGALFGDLFPEDGGVVEWARVGTDLAPGEQAYCAANPTLNSTGRAANLSSNHNRSLAANALVLYAQLLPPGSFGYFLCSQTASLPAQPPGSQGTLCLGGAIGRFVGPGQISMPSPSGFLSLPIDLTALPSANGPLSAQPGDRWHFQFWYRDANPGPTSNLTQALWLTVE